MNRLIPGIPFLAALSLVLFAIFNYALSERIPDPILEGSARPVAEMECTAINAISPVGENDFQWLSLEKICEKALEENSVVNIETTSEDHNLTAQKVSSEKDEVIWSSLQLNHQKTALAFFSQKKLFIVDLTTGDSKRIHDLLSEEKNAYYNPSITWSPNGEYLTFTVVKENNRWNGQNSYSTYLVNLTSEDIHSIHQTQQAPESPTWSPKGDYIALDSPVVLYDLARKHGTTIVSGYHTRYPRWSPEGHHIIFIQETSSTRGETFRYSLDTREVIQITALNRVTSPLLWLQTPPTILLEVETKKSSNRPERHHIGEARPHTESSIRWLSSFDRNESNRFLTLSPNERYLIIQKTANLGTKDEENHLIAINREQSFYSWRCVSIAPLEDPKTLTFQWTDDGRLLYNKDGQAFIFDFERLTIEEFEEQEEEIRLLGIKGQTIYYSPF
ncbi:hypothetical protein F9B85_09400 [Heliorestis acidaminivorans]|uniref:Dipeptidylpeptidase IV N-terminal domain-containing protein n=1 Tax=Heliorestis acidaminivorans TaxID=553427 RepID=A0A6I0F1S4_9FIRM|nr:hypothetical protein [Heliorestis acidaminivorans]KAB2952361.1 hypothetical protein F9B85_09400 [Heliorestis acidaminivorans]